MEEELPGGWSAGWRNRLDCPKGLDWAPVPGWAELHRRWKLVGQLGKTARNNRKCSALCPRCWTGTLRMMALSRRQRECGQMTESFSLPSETRSVGVGGSIPLPQDGKVPHWGKMMKRTDVLRGAESHEWKITVYYTWTWGRGVSWPRPALWAFTGVVPSSRAPWQCTAIVMSPLLPLGPV